jgi:hypothetical protein
MFKMLLSKKIILLFILPLMAKGISLNIKENYQLFLDLLNIRKSILEEVIPVNQKANNIHFLKSSTKVFHASIDDEILFIINAHKTDHKKFEFKLLCNALCEKPFFRYDSYGTAHRQKNKIRLEEQMIETPHFNKFNEKGECFAFRTDKLNDAGERKALEDINFCVVHYFNEGNMRVKEDEFPTIKLKEIGLFPSTDYDPNANIIFN